MSGAALTTCPSCGFEDRGDRDFCANCGAYLRWGEDPAEADTAVLTPLGPESSPRPAEPIAPPAPPAPVPAPMPAEPVLEPVLLTLRVPGAGGVPGEAPALDVAPGGQASLLATVRNQSGIVDGFELHVKGLPRHWCTVAPAMLDLVPFGAENGRAEGEVTILLQVPRSPEARAGAWPIEVAAVSRSTGSAVASAPATLVVGAYEHFESRIRPERARGAGSAQFAVPVRNLGNAPLALEFAGEDTDGEVRFRFEPPRLEVGVGEEGHSIVTASAPRPLSGRARERSLTVFVSGAHQSLSGRAVFVQTAQFTRGRLTAWRIVVGLVGVALIALSSFAAWTDSGLTGLCLGGADSCLRYDEFARVYIGADPPVPDVIEETAALSLLTSAGVGTLVLALLVLLGLRRGGLAWFGGVVAVVGSVLLLVLGDVGAGAGVWMLFVGGVLAVVAGLLASGNGGR